MQTIKNIFITLIIILIAYIILKKLNIVRIESSTIEGFQSTIWSGNNDVFGNLIYNNSNFIIPKRQQYINIKLAGNYKLTGFKIKLTQKQTPLPTSSTPLPTLIYVDTTGKKYSLSIGNNSNDMVKVINQYGLSNHNFNKLVNDTSLFENEDGTSKYNGKIVKVSFEDLEFDNHKTDEYKLEVKLYGLDIYALNSKSYEKYKTLLEEDFTVASGNNKMSIEFIDKDNNNEEINKKIIALQLSFTNNTRTSPPRNELFLKYTNKFDNKKRKYIITGPINQKFLVKDGTMTIYFNKPIIASNLYLSLDNNTNLNISATNIKIYGDNVGKRDEINFKFNKQIDDNNDLGISIQGEKCPSINQIMRRQTQSQQICEALEYKDRIKNSKNVYEKEKVYLRKLAKQEQDIRDLEELINKLVSRKNDRIKKNKHHNVEELDRELKKIEESRKALEKDLVDTKKNHDLKLSLNLEPKFNDVLSKYNL